MGILNSLFGYRWSLYVIKNDKDLVYAMHENSVMRMLGYCEGSFANGAEPIDPWSLYLNFNRTHKTIKLTARHFGSNGPTRVLTEAINAIDPGWQVRGSEPIFEEAATKKRLNISSNLKNGRIDLQAMMQNIGKPEETTFFSVMDSVFGRR